MISFFTGVPGSGKTYYAVDKIFNNFSTHKEAKKDKNITYEICYTNINEFKFDKVENVLYLDFDELKRNLTTLHRYYKDKKDDDFLIEKCKEYNIYNALFVIDEAHNYFDIKDVVLVWWLSYHRHLYHEIILITQNLALIESKYKSFSEFFYKAFAQSLTLIKTHFKYNVYVSSRMSNISKSGTMKIKRNDFVFDLYKSGDSINSQNVVLKFIIFVIITLFFLVLFFKFYLLDKMQKEDIKPIKPTEKISNNDVPFHKVIAPVAVPDIKDFTDKKFMTFKCSSNICISENKSIPKKLLQNLIQSSALNVLYIDKSAKYINIYYVEASQSFYNFITLKGDLTDEQPTKKPNSFIVGH